MRHCQMDWNESGSRCLTNIPGMQCPRCNKELEPDVEHECGRPPGKRHKFGDAHVTISETTKKARKKK